MPTRFFLFSPCVASLRKLCYLDSTTGRRNVAVHAASLAGAGLVSPQAAAHPKFSAVPDEKWAQTLRDAGSVSCFSLTAAKRSSV